MATMRFGTCQHNVTLVDDGTLDTVVRVDGNELRFDQEYAAEFRKRDGTLTEAGLRRLLNTSHDVACWSDDIADA